VTAFAGAPSFGGDPGDPATLVADPTASGYWLVLRNGTVQAFGSAPQLSSKMAVAFRGWWGERVVGRAAQRRSTAHYR
jgi:hypothetical protein